MFALSNQTSFMITLLMLPTSKILAHFRLWLCSALEHQSINLSGMSKKCNNQTGQGSQIILCAIPQPGSRQHTLVETHFFFYISMHHKNVAYSSAFTFSHLIMFLKVSNGFSKSWIHIGYIYIENEYLPIHVVNWYTLLYCFYVKTLPSEEVICFWKIQQIVLLHGLKNLFLMNKLKSGYCHQGKVAFFLGCT